MEPSLLQHHLRLARSPQDFKGHIADASGILDNHLEDLGRAVIIERLLVGFRQRHVDHAANIGIHFGQHLLRLDGQVAALRRFPWEISSSA